MSKILVGRDEPKEVEVGVTVSVVAQKDAENAEAKEELVEEAVEDEQVVAPEEGDVPQKAQTPVKGRGKKRGKA